MTSWNASEIKQMPVSDLIPYDRNPRSHPDSQIDELANSISEWGFTVPILIDDGGNVIAGHGRLYAAQKLGYEAVPAIVTEGWTEEQKKAYVIADNRLAENGSWDSSLFFSELRDLSDGGFDLSLVGMGLDFTFDDFEPNLSPMINFSEVEASDIEKAQDGISGQIEGLGQDKADSAVEVMCPYCSETFSFSGT
jgi:ParB-like chromosome segregation protein Spo0J